MTRQDPWLDCEEQDQCRIPYKDTMRSFTAYITESKTTEKIARSICDMFVGTKITKEIVMKMLSNLDADMLKEMSDEFYRRDGKNYIVYQPSNDMFLGDKQEYIPQMADYISRFVAI